MLNFLFYVRPYLAFVVLKLLKLVYSVCTLGARGFVFLLFGVNFFLARNDRGFAAQFSQQTKGKNLSGTQGILYAML